MVKKQTILGLAAAAAIALLPMAPAMANGHGFRPLHPFGLGHGLLGAAVTLATLPLVLASNVVASVGESVEPAYGYAPPAAYVAPRPYYAPYYSGYYAPPRVAYGPHAYYGVHPGYYGRGYYRQGGHSYPRR